MLKQMEAEPVSEIGEVLARIQSLQQIKRDITRTSRTLSSHLQRLRESEGDSAVAAEMEDLGDRLDAQLMILDVQAERLRALGFDVTLDTPEDSSMDVSETTETTVTTTTTTTVEVQSTPSSHKKPRLTASPAVAAPAASAPAASAPAPDYSAFVKWADQAEETLKQCSLEVEEGEAELAAVSARLDHIEVGRQDFADLPTSDETCVELRRRSSLIGRQCTAVRNQLNLLQEQRAWSRRREQLARAAARPALPEGKPTNNQLIHLRNKIRQLKQIEPQLQELSAQAIVLQTKPLSAAHKDNIDKETKKLQQEYQETLTLLMQKEQDIKLALKKRPGQKHEDDFKSLQAKIQNIEAQIISEHAMYSSVEDMKKKIEDLNGLKKELDDLQAMYDGVVRDRRDKYEKGSVEELSFRNSLENLVFMFGDTKNILDQKIGKLEKGVELVTSLNARVTSVRAWTARAQEFVSDHSSVPVGDTEKLEALLDQSNKLEEEKAEIKTKLSEIETIKSEILEDCAEEFSRSIKEDTGELQSKFDAVCEPAFQLNEGLRRGLEKTEAVYRMMDEIEEFLSSIEAAMPSAAECDIADSSQLYHMKCRFQALKDRCDQTTELFREANEQGNGGIIMQPAVPHEVPLPGAQGPLRPDHGAVPRG
ncbi:hypothetical protein JYU34_005489 [Plutella xylostella]|uniref:Uncharacterized protein n=1 Tax=Plutella xylostella TaxID=51655 RepID=A0ABQ7QWU3_PLUXY|nr:hypothetical protein JYU34_005489 [Plutella xylostella]